MVRAKFKVDKIERIATQVPKKNADGSLFKSEKGYYEHEPGEMQTIALSPVYANNDPNHENSKFWAASPSGQITLGCANADATKYFELGKEYYIDFSKAE